MSGSGPIDLDDTIAAIATPVAQSAIGIVRISGPKAMEIASLVLNHPGSSQSHRFYHSKFIYDEQVLDDVMFCFMKGPRSFTGEDLLEIYCHGNPWILKKIQECLISKGARLAAPGEFTQRAFLHGKMDLSQAEAVIELIQAKSDLQRRCALEQLQGEFSKMVSTIREEIFEVMVETEANIDFPDYVPEGVSQERLRNILEGVLSKIRELLSSVKNQRILKNGFQVVLMGEPNVGKSSLLNALVGSEVAIVTELPGTTRDAIRHEMDIHGITVHLTDTAGIRTPENIIEEKGIDISRRKYQEADLILWIWDYSNAADFKWAKEYLSHQKPCRMVVNKIDLAQGLEIKELEKEFSGMPIIKTSAIHGTGIHELRAMIEKWVLGHTDLWDTRIILNERHREILIEAEKSIGSAVEAIQADLGDDLIASDLRDAVRKLDEIVGREVDEEMIQSIFSRFCIGK